MKRWVRNPHDDCRNPKGCRCIRRQHPASAVHLGTRTRRFRRRAAASKAIGGAADGQYGSLAAALAPRTDDPFAAWGCFAFPAFSHPLPGVEPHE